MLARALARVRVRRGSTAHGLDDELAQLRPGGAPPAMRAAAPPSRPRRDHAPARARRRRRRRRRARGSRPALDDPRADRHGPMKGASRSTGPGGDRLLGIGRGGDAGRAGPSSVVVVARRGRGRGHAESASRRARPPPPRRSRLPASARRRREGAALSNVPSSACSGTRAARACCRAARARITRRFTCALAQQDGLAPRGVSTSSSSAAAAASPVSGVGRPRSVAWYAAGGCAVGAAPPRAARLAARTAARCGLGAEREARRRRRRRASRRR